MVQTRLIAYKYRLLPDEAQRQFLCRCFGCTRLVYNQYVEFSLNEHKRVKEEGGEYNDIPQVSLLKESFPFLRDVDSLSLANAKRNFESARKAWWNSLKKKRKGKGAKA